MDRRIYAYLIVAAAAFGGCSGPERRPPPPDVPADAEPTPVGIRGVWQIATLALSQEKPPVPGANYLLDVVRDPDGSRPDAWRMRLRANGQPAGDPKAAAGSDVTTAPSDFDREGVEHAVLQVTLSEKDAPTPVRLELRFEGDEVTGYWEYTGERHTELVEKTPDGELRRSKVYGVLVGRRGGDAPDSLGATTELPCVTCCNALERCGAQGPQACNASMICLEECRDPEGGVPFPREACLHAMLTGAGSDEAGPDGP